MFHKIKEISAMPDYRLSIQFAEGVTKIYDVAPLIEKNPMFSVLKSQDFFKSVAVDAGGYGAVWGDDADISCDELFEYGIPENQ